MPPVLTLLFKLIFPCLKTQAQENNKVKYINLMQNPPFFAKNIPPTNQTECIARLAIRGIYHAEMIDYRTAAVRSLPYETATTPATQE